MLAIGLMSGTSADGVDACLVSFKEEIKLLDFLSVPFEEKDRLLIEKCMDEKRSCVSDISILNFRLPYLYKEAIDKILQKNNLKYADIEFIASHGQTLWHDNSLFPHTFQIGDGSVLSALTQTRVIYNFRVADVALMGTGAPLVPKALQTIYREKMPIIFQNIGGISNITVLKKTEVKAYDQGVGNRGIDYFMKKLFNKNYDEEGNIARQGSVIKKLYEYLISNPYYTKNPPKSTGRELFSPYYYESIFSKFSLDKVEKADVIRTMLEEVVFVLTKSYEEEQVKDIVITGGGALNSFLVERLREENPSKNIMTGKECMINEEATEALCFAVLGYLTLMEQPGNLKEVTGATSDVVLGTVAYNKKGKEK